MFLGILLAGLLAISCAAEYSVPEPKFHLLKPRGFRVSIPDEAGIKLFAFHGNLNKELEQMGNGQFSQDITTKRNGKWIYENKKMKLRNGDAIYYWIFVIKNGEGFTYENGTHICKTIFDTGKGSGSLKKMHAHYHHKEKRSPSWQRFDDGPHFYHNPYSAFPIFPGHRNGHFNDFHDHGRFNHHGRFPHRFHNNGHHNHQRYHHNHDNEDCSNSEDSDYSDYDNSPENDQTTARVPTTNQRIIKPSSTTTTTTTPIPTTTQMATTKSTTQIPTTPVTTTTTTSFPRIDIRFGEK
ncbi:PREDICTED: uncharacterized protein LOC108561775 isoform X1 [Nicrophorus vespilloides]|uniref:Uncharacterized protein LOC108561775 isoform X1 n=1 Tax=Nicrophorus vespilloides TaxID=110193 RepID=A0ABM1ML73_NICVS|nr:PREDICTED: uncharacterized protein LOC108561775 isoform X1 [Nicrophorus vespilloides]